MTGDYGRIADYLFATTGWLRLWEIYLTLWEATGGLFDTMGELGELQRPRNEIMQSEFATGGKLR